LPRTDPDTLGLVRGAYRVSDRLEILSRVSRIQTWNLAEFGFSIVDSKQAGAGVRVTPAASIQLIADGSLMVGRGGDLANAWTDAWRWNSFEHELPSRTRARLGLQRATQRPRKNRGGAC